MPIVRGLLDRVILVSAAVGGGLVPGYIAQYRQRLGGRLDQARIDLQPWQNLADKFYHGDIEKLIQYHLSSTDATFHSEGAIIRTLVDTVHRLQAAVDAMHGSLASQAAYLALHGDPGIASAAFADWVPTFALSADGLLFAAIFAVVIWLAFHSVWWAGARGGRALRRPPQRQRRIEPTL